MPCKSRNISSATKTDTLTMVLAEALVTQPTAIFFIVLVIILSAPLLLNRLKIPHVVGMIAAGVAVGPYGFHVLENDSSFAIFGQVGLLYLMFLAGLEIDMFQLKLNLKRGLVFGLLTLLVPLFLGVITSVWILGLDWLTAFFLGSMYASHTLISYPVATRFGVTRSPAVIISIVGTIIAVVGALLVLAGAVNVHKEGAFRLSAILRLLGFMAVYCIVILYSYPRITRGFFKIVSDKVTQYVFILAMVFLAAIGAQLIGIEPVLGAFFAGLVLNRYVPVGSALMTSIEFVGNALFIPYFLISVGMMINMRVIFNLDTLAIAGIMLSVALISKWIPAFITQKIDKLSTSSRGVMFGLTTAHTAVALAVVALGVSLGMFDERVLNSTILVILVTCTIAPIFTASSASKLKIEMIDSEDGAGDNLMKRTDHIKTLVTVSTPVLAPPLIDLAMLMRDTRKKHDLYALHVRSDNSPQAKALSRATLYEAKKTAAGADVPIETLDRFDINIVTGVINTINEREISEVIMGMHRRTNIIDSFLGSNITQLLRSTNKMVVIARTFIPTNAYTRIVVWAPPKAQYETGFSLWIRMIARLTRQLGCRAIFCCASEAQPLIRGLLYQENFGIRCEFRSAESWDDFIPLGNRILDDDLLVVISARANSVSYTPEMADIPAFLEKYFSQNNLLVVYPEQFGEEIPLTSFADPMAADIESAPAPVSLKIRAWLRKLNEFKKRFTHRNRTKKF